jgi:lipopolysaccharide transport system ATP-binding protein
MSRNEIARKFDEIVAFAEVEQFLDTPVKHYSSGMYVRLAFAVAAHLESEILIVDEVLAVGDAVFQKKCLAKMEDVAGHGRTVLFVSHNMAVVRAFCSRGVVFDAGQIVADTDMITAVDHYLKGGSTGSGSIIWSEDNAPRCSEIALRQAYLLGPTGQTSDLIDTAQEFDIVLEYQVIRPVAQMITGFTIQSSDGTIMCGSNDWKESNPQIREAGLYRSICRFPGYVFNKGRYNVTFAVDVAPHDEHRIKTDFCLAFDVEDYERHGPRVGTLPGVARPRLNWTISPVAP